MQSEDAYEPWYRCLYYPAYSRFDGLLVGVCAEAIECFSPRVWTRLSGRPWLLLATGSALLLASFWISGDRSGLVASAISFPLFALAYGFMVIAAVSPRSVLHRVHLRRTALIAPCLIPCI